MATTVEQLQEQVMRALQEGNALDRFQVDNLVIDQGYELSSQKQPDRKQKHMEPKQNREGNWRQVYPTP